MRRPPLWTVKKYYFLTKRLQSAARIICASTAHKFHTCSLRSIFFAAHVAEENDFTFFRRSGGETLRGFLHRACQRTARTMSRVMSPRLRAPHIYIASVSSARSFST